MLPGSLTGHHSCQYFCLNQPQTCPLDVPKDGGGRREGVGERERGREEGMGEGARGGSGGVGEGERERRG